MNHGSSKNMYTYVMYIHVGIWIVLIELLYITGGHSPKLSGHVLNELLLHEINAIKLMSCKSISFKRWHDMWQFGRVASIYKAVRSMSIPPSSSSSRKGERWTGRPCCTHLLAISTHLLQRERDSLFSCRCFLHSYSSLVCLPLRSTDEKT